MRIIGDYLWVEPATKTSKANIKRELEVEDEDLSIPFWGPDIRKTCDIFNLSPIQRMSLRKGEAQKKYVERSLVTAWIEERKSIRRHRENVISLIDDVSTDLHKLFLQDRRYRRKAERTVESDIIPHMDGSTLLWLDVILKAKKDFLKLHADPRRIQEWWDDVTPEDLLEEDGTVKRGKEEVWLYVTARDFLLDDSYTIDLDEPDCNQGVSLEDLLDYLVESFGGKSLDSSFINPSISHLRAQIAKATGDPKLIAIYCAEE